MKDFELYISFILIFAFAFVDYPMLLCLHSLSFDMVSAASGFSGFRTIPDWFPVDHLRLF
jgi:hypothetical protein